MRFFRSRKSKTLEAECNRLDWTSGIQKEEINNDSKFRRGLRTVLDALRKTKE